jgi:hypothetical protein
VCGSKFVHHGATTRLNKHLIQKHSIKLAVVNKNNEATNGAMMNDNEQHDSKLPLQLNNLMQHSQALSGITAAASSNAVNRSMANNYDSHVPMNGHHPSALHTATTNTGHFDMSHLAGSSKINSLSTAHNNNNNNNNSNSKNANFSDSNMLLVSFILSSSTSIDLLENKWFRMFIENLNNSYKLPTKDELNNMFKNLYKDKKVGE